MNQVELSFPTQRRNVATRGNVSRFAFVSSYGGTGERDVSDGGTILLQNGWRNSGALGIPALLPSC